MLPFGALLRIVAVACLATLSVLAWAEDGQDLEKKIKAACVANFPQFVDWPERSFQDGAAPFIIGVLGENPLGDNLALAVAGKRVNGREIKVKYFTDIADADCHMLLVNSSNPAELRRILEKVKEKPVLTVGESEEFLQQGGMIRVVRAADRIKLEINADAASAAKLRISSKLLRLGNIVTVKDEK